MCETGGSSMCGNTNHKMSGARLRAAKLLKYKILKI